MLLRRVLVLVLVLAPRSVRSQSTYPCQKRQPLHGSKVCNVSLSPLERAASLVTMLNVTHKAQQPNNDAPAIPELGVPSYQWWTEALHGVYSDCSPKGSCPSSYPCALNLAATFNMSVVSTIGKQISDEARALYKQGTIRGLDFWAPNLNIVRDPRWGRGQETPGEDPFLNGLYGVHYIRAMQTDPTSTYYYKTVATPKHFAAYNLDEWRDVSRLSFDAKTSMQDLWQSYFPAFKMAIVDGGARSVMCSYNAVNGVPSCANSYLLNEVLRKKWGFEGYVVSDCDAVYNVYSPHKYNSSLEAASVESIRAGTDLNCGDSYAKTFQDAMQKGILDKETIDLALQRLFAHRIMLGTFDDPNTIKTNDVTDAVIDSTEHRSHARDAGSQSIVLLKNEAADGDKAPLLPLDPSKITTISLSGPNADDGNLLCSNYHGALPKTIGIRQGLSDSLRGTAVKVDYHKGCNMVDNSWDGFSDAVDSARDADVAVVVLGLDQSQESEGHDRSHTRLPGVQLELLKGILNVQPRTVLVVVGGSSVDIEFAKHHVPAILYAFYPGEEGGNSIADVLLGDVNPSGRLPITIYKDEDVTGESGFDMASMDMRAGKGRTYRFFAGEPVYRFGDGLSYSTFTITPLPGLNDVVAVHDSVSVSVKVVNTGSRAGAYSVLGIIKQSDTTACPRSQLFDFAKVLLAPGESQTVKLTLYPAGTLCVHPSYPRQGLHEHAFLPDVNFHFHANEKPVYSFHTTSPSTTMEAQ